MRLLDRYIHTLVVGNVGTASKTVTIKEDEFKKELAPPNATFERVIIQNQKFITMTYSY